MRAGRRALLGTKAGSGLAESTEGFNQAPPPNAGAALVLGPHTSNISLILPVILRGGYSGFPGEETEHREGW